MKVSMVIDHHRYHGIFFLADNEVFAGLLEQHLNEPIKLAVSGI